MAVQRMKLRRRNRDHWSARVPATFSRICDAELVIVDGKVVKHRLPLEGAVVIVSSTGSVSYLRQLDRG